MRLAYIHTFIRMAEGSLQVSQALLEAAALCQGLHTGARTLTLGELMAHLRKRPAG